MRFSINLFIVFYFFSIGSIHAQQAEFNHLKQQFVKAYEAMDLPALQLDYVENLSNIKSKEAVLQQDETFNTFIVSLNKIDTRNLSESDKLDFELMKYEIALNKFRLRLEKKWHENKPKQIDKPSLAYVPDGKRWYSYFLKKWVDVKATPESMYHFGLSEIQRVKLKMKSIQENSGLDSIRFAKQLEKSKFFYSKPQQILKAYKNKKKEVNQKITNLFPGLAETPNVQIKEFKEKTSIETPGFYRSTENTLYFKYFDRPYSKRQVGWLYIHEGIPGHHYQIKYAERLQLSALQKLVSSSCYKEGWAAYIEEIGYEIGAYKNEYDAYGKWEWDLIRSVRVVLDVGLNYHGWTDKKALAFWQQHIQNQDHIAEREIKRMKKWPAQVITYKYGVNKFLSWRKASESEAGFSVKNFHKDVLQYGAIPLFVLERQLGYSGTKEIHNIPYTTPTRMVDNPNQRLNLVLPLTSEKVPLLIWIGGGAWAYVDRTMEMNVARNFAKEGIAVASVGHRLSADWRDSTYVVDIQHPEHAKDIATATKWLIDHSDTYGYDSKEIFIGGFSSGAHLASILALDERFLKTEGLSKDVIKGIIPIGGTYDISNYHNAFLEGSRPELAILHVESVFGNSEKHFKDASPISYLDNLSVPIYLFSDSNTYNYTKLFEDAIRQRNFKNFEVEHVELSHKDLWTNLSEEVQSTYRDSILEFIKSKK